jgi:hypothetical protein
MAYAENSIDANTLVNLKEIFTGQSLPDLRYFFSACQIRTQIRTMQAAGRINTTGDALDPYLPHQVGYHGYVPRFNA